MSFWMLSCLMLVLLRPLESADFWGLLAAGRATLASAAAFDLPAVTTEHAHNRWLGGVPWFLAWQTTDFLLLPWLPLAAGFLVLPLLRPVARHAQVSPLALAFCPLLLLCLRPALQPCYSCNAVFCLLLLHGLICRRRSLWTDATIPLLMLTWANTGPVPLWGVLWLITARDFSCGCWRFRTAVVFSAIAICVCPGGLHAVSADVRELTAGLDPVWRIWQSEFPSAASEIGFSGLPAFLLLAATALVPRIVGQGQFTVGWLVRFCFAAVAGFLNPAHIPLAALSIVMLQHDNLTEHTATRQNREPSVTDRRRISGISIAIVLLMLPWLLLDACGRGGFSTARIGWGYAQLLDLRLLDIPSISPTNARPRIWAADRRSAGIAAWRNDAVEHAGDPDSAFRAGRLTIALQLLRDLRDGRRAAYRRSDGSRGGWHSQFRDLNVDLLLVPVEYQLLNEELQRSTWKILDLDSPHILWASSETGSFTASINESAAQQNFVQWGTWQPDSAIYDPVGARLDVCHLLGLGADPQPALRQSSLFRTLRLPLAAARSLWPLHDNAAAGVTGSREICRELQNCQQDLAEFEWDNYGITAVWRRQVLRALAARSGRTVGNLPWNPASLKDDHAELSTAALLYAAGDLEQALQVLNQTRATPTASIESSYAKAMILLEQGNLQSARSVLQQLADTPLSSNNPSAGLALAARGWLALTVGRQGE